MSSGSDEQQQPGLVGSHAQYVKGAAVGAVGAVTGSEEWKQSGEQQKEAAVEAMRKAGETRDPKASGFGAVEETLGKAVGCEGMKEEGAATKNEYPL